jgi:thiamine biosynthesis lipoprotein
VTTVAPTRVAIPLQLGRAAPLQAPLQHIDGRTMGTSWSAKFVGSAAAAQTLRRAIVAALDRVVVQMSPWETGSALSEFNDGPLGEWHELPREFATVMAEALRIAGESDGAFDPTMGPLVDLWGFGPQGRPPALPSVAEIAQQRGICGWRQLEFDASSRRLRRLSACRLDLNGIAKGFAVDLVMTTLRQHAIHHALVEIGGELAGAGLKPDGTPWWVDIDAPMASSGVPALRAALHGLAIATSGCERGYDGHGRRLSHTIDPRSGVPIDNAMVTATVLHESCMAADAYATALIVMGFDAGIAFATRHKLAAAIRFHRDATTIDERLSPALQAMLD